MGEGQLKRGESEKRKPTYQEIGSVEFENMHLIKLATWAIPLESPIVWNAFVHLYTTHTLTTSHSSYTPEHSQTPSGLQILLHSHTHIYTQDLQECIKVCECVVSVCARVCTCGWWRKGG